MSSSNERLERIRAELAARQGRKAADPNEWRPPQAQRGQTLNIKFIVLPPLEIGSPCASGKAKTDMKGLYSHRVGMHWINNKPNACPRVADGTDCPYCSHGFDLLGETEDPMQRKEIIKAYLPREVHAVNVYFPAVKSNPPELQGKVKWFGVTQKTVLDQFNECLNRNESDAKGDTEEENQAWGFFYEPEESYHFLLNITLKNKYNDYSGSKFIPSTRGPIVRKKDGTLDEERMAAILAQRHDLAPKFPVPDADKLQKLLNTLKSQPLNEPADAGFDDDETKPAAPSPAKQSTIEEDLEEAIDAEPAPKVSTPAPKAAAPSTPASPPAAKAKAAPPEDDTELDSLLKQIED